MPPKGKLGNRGQSDFLKLMIVTLSVGTIMAIYYGLFQLFQQFTTPVISAFIATGLLAIFLGVSVRRKFKYGQVIPEQYFPEHTLEENPHLSEETEQLLEETKHLEDLENDSSASTILSDEETTSSEKSENPSETKTTDIDPNSIPDDLYMKVLKNKEYSLEEAKRDAENRSKA